MSEYNFDEDVRTQAVIDGKMVKYDACATGNLEESIHEYRNAFKYLGTANGIFINGEHKHDGQPHHIFINLKQQHY